MKSKIKNQIGNTWMTPKTLTVSCSFTHCTCKSLKCNIEIVNSKEVTPCLERLE